jgi:hypothetical protein
MSTQINADNIHVGLPEQTITGAILHAPVGTPLPSGVHSDIDPAFESAGFISEDGLTANISSSITEIPDWSGVIVKIINEQFGLTFTYDHLEINEQSLKQEFGGQNVTVTPADGTHGNELSVAIKKTVLPHMSYVIKLCEGDFRAMIVIPDGQVVNEDIEIPFVSGDAIKFPISLRCFDTDNKTFAYLYTDDGKFDIHNTHTVNFDLSTHGIEWSPPNIEPQTVNNGDFATKPDDPVAIVGDVHFIYWSTVDEPTGTRPPRFEFESTPITDDITLYPATDFNG